MNFLNLPAIKSGLELLTRYRDILPLRLSLLAHYLTTQLSALRRSSGAPVVQILSTPPTPLTVLGEESPSGAVVSCVLLDSRGVPLRNDAVERAAHDRVALRAGCHCNPGAVMLLLHRSGLFAQRGDPTDWMASIHLRPETATKDAVARSLFAGDTAFGVLRFSLGLGSNFRDVWTVVEWVQQAAKSLDYRS